jgi:hypothetical protein
MAVLSPWVASPSLKATREYLGRSCTGAFSASTAGQRLRNVGQPVKTLVAGWFSSESGHATAGDLITRDLVCEWLQAARHPYDLAVAPPFTGALTGAPQTLEITRTSCFVCGPFGPGGWEREFLDRFAGCRLIGMDLSMKVPLDEWNLFDLLIERDSSARANPDLSFLSRQALVPVVGICRVEDYEGAPITEANLAIDRLIGSKQISIVEIDTRLDEHSTGRRAPVEVESLLARMDAVVTTRLHGTVFSLKNGIPVVAINPEVGRWKIRCQAESIGSPVIFNVDNLTDDTLQKALDFCLTERRGPRRARAGKGRESWSRQWAGIH